MPSTGVLRGGLFNYAVSVPLVGTADTYITGDQASALKITFTGALAAPMNVILPLTTEDYGQAWTMVNNSGQTLTIKGGSGAGFTLVNGATEPVGWNGAAMVAGGAALSIGLNDLAEYTRVIPAVGDVGITIQGAPAQTGDLLQLKDSSGTVLTRFTAGGLLAFGTAGTAGERIRVGGVIADTAGARFITVNGSITNSAGAAGTVTGINNNPTFNGSGGTISALIASFNQPGYQGTIAPSLLIGNQSRVQISGASPTGTIASAYSFHADVTANNASGTPAVTLTSRVGVRVENMGSGHGVNGLTITNAYGIQIANQTAVATEALAIDSLGGTVRIATGADATIGLVVKRNSVGQSAAMQTWAMSDGVTPLLSVAGAGHLTFADAINVIFGTTTGTQIGTVGGAAGQKIAFWGAAPAVQPLCATGTGKTVDQLITILQTMGLLRQA